MWTLQQRFSDSNNNYYTTSLKNAAAVKKVGQFALCLFLSFYRRCIHRLSKVTKISSPEWKSGFVANSPSASKMISMYKMYVVNMNCTQEMLFPSDSAGQRKQQMNTTTAEFDIWWWKKKPCVRSCFEKWWSGLIIWKYLTYTLTIMCHRRLLRFRTDL